jgi:hypothetical protein
MFRNRKQDTASSTSDSKPVISKLKDIIAITLDAVRHFITDDEKLDSDAFKLELDQTLAQLKETSDVEKLTAIEQSLKKLFYRQRDAEGVYRQNQHAEYAKLVATLVEGINEFRGVEIIKRPT